jgi:hypothetical protein
MKLLAEPAGRSLERTGNRASRGMIAHDKTRLIGQLLPYVPLLTPSYFPFVFSYFRKSPEDAELMPALIPGYA